MGYTTVITQYIKFYPRKYIFSDYIFKKRYWRLCHQRAVGIGGLINLYDRRTLPKPGQQVGNVVCTVGSSATYTKRVIPSRFHILPKFRNWKQNNECDLWEKSWRLFIRIYYKLYYFVYFKPHACRGLFMSPVQLTPALHRSGLHLPDPCNT